jgi:outer membrane protein assembly factor BamB
MLAAGWPQWRGPHFNGSSDDTGLPSTWSKDTVVWCADLPGPSAATPAVWEDRVFVSTTDTASGTLHARCLDRQTGKVLWDRQVADGLRRDEKSNFASPSPVADAGRVWFFYGNGSLVAFDHAGRQLWSRNLTREFGEFAFQWTFASSPLFWNDRLYVQVLQRDVPVNGRGRADGPIESFLLAIDPATGKTLWRVVRPSEAVAESHESYSTPIPLEDDGRKEILLAGGDCLTAQDAETGRELWRWGTWNPRKIGHWRLIPSPVTGGGVVLVCAPKGDPVYAIRPGGNGLLNESAVVWQTDRQREVTSDVPTPLFYQGDFFVLSDVRKNLSRVAPATGRVKWTVDLPGRRKFEASPTGADGKVYLMNFGGEVVVVDAEAGTILSTVPMGEEGDDMIRSTVAVASGQLFIRTNHRLFCVGRR